MVTEGKYCDISWTKRMIRRQPGYFSRVSANDNYESLPSRRLIWKWLDMMVRTQNINGLKAKKRWLNRRFRVRCENPMQRIKALRFSNEICDAIEEIRMHQLNEFNGFIDDTEETMLTEEDEEKALKKIKTDVPLPKTEFITKVITLGDTANLEKEARRVYRKAEKCEKAQKRFGSFLDQCKELGGDESVQEYMRETEKTREFLRENKIELIQVIDLT